MNKRSALIAGIIVLVLIVGGAIIWINYDKFTSVTSTPSSSVPALHNVLVSTKTNATLGEFLTDPNGKPLYTYSSDKSGVSNCQSTCLATWPAYVDTGASTGLPAGFGAIRRTDNGKLQYTYEGKPLYYFIGDVLGHVNGNGVSGFYVAKPQAGSSANSPSPTAATGSTSASGSSSSW